MVYDYHSLKKVAQTSGNLGQIKVYDAQDGYHVVFKDCTDQAADIFMIRLNALTRNQMRF